VDSIGSGTWSSMGMEPFMSRASLSENCINIYH
jgi:hypothetical protein